MSGLTLHLRIDEQATADRWVGAITHFLRHVADEVELAPGPVEFGADWPDLESWDEHPMGERSRPVSLSRNTAIALWALTRSEAEDGDPLVARLEDALRRAGWAPPPEAPDGHQQRARPPDREVAGGLYALADDMEHDVDAVLRSLPNAVTLVRHAAELLGAR